MEDIARFIFEAGNLKRTKRSGWWFYGDSGQESVADHSFRAALIGMILADMEQADTGKVVRMLLLHDMAEARIGDITRYPGKSYINADEAEKRVTEDQTSRLPKKMSEEFSSLVEEYNNCETKEATIAKDADILELLSSVREKYGSEHMDKWDKRKNSLKTESAKKLLAAIESTNPFDWWKNAKKID